MLNNQILMSPYLFSFLIDHRHLQKISYQHAGGENGYKNRYIVNRIHINCLFYSYLSVHQHREKRVAEMSEMIDLIADCHLLIENWRAQSFIFR